MKNSKIRFVAILSILLLSGFLSTCLISYYVAHDSLSEQITETTLPLTSDNIYSEIQRDLLRPVFISSLMAQDTFLRDWTMAGEQDDKAVIRYLKEIQLQYDTVTSFFVSEKTRKYYHPSGVLKTVSQTDPQDAWYFRVQKMRDPYEVNVDTDTADKNSMVIFINYRVFDYAGRYIGATGVGLAVNAVRDLIDSYQHRYGRKIYFINPEGRLTLHGLNYTGPDNIRKVPGLSKHATRILTTPSNALTYTDEGKTIYVNSRMVPQFEWFLLVMQADDPAEGRILNTLMINLLVSFTVTAIVLLLAYITIGGYQRRLEEMATMDKLTGAANRQVFDMLFNQSVKQAKRRNSPLAAIMFDIDHFKNINDTYGHTIGDLILKAVTRTAKSHIRDSDILCRWGGEEFLILLTDCNLEQARTVAEKIRKNIEVDQNVLHQGKTISVTASFGVTQIVNQETVLDVTIRVDKALYAAKGNGRNRTEVTP
ncbi:diguanylate cyclase (GGDEF) domain-containing protein [Desulfocicer vacuolatum DSM 3385]|uniref:diguanylate cyclase n=1 Tax=Desulfocicer vacuolatum DSM 3385 TaxID=1121400 RepID=A0A1W2DXP7_9BACT|nr:sensor domain-containing diguanylate cyclase [Desulfocicer vacuolatum]SMD01836.1 diguanylate cyclase (GGDEF) domain-containing protein [Desulfocicer vacuolatum DSM 3385]